jgi:hypothetical protein
VQEGIFFVWRCQLERRHHLSFEISKQLACCIESSSLGEETLVMEASINVQAVTDRSN